MIVANQFAGVLTSATETIASGMDTRVAGTPLVVSNALNVDREDLVEAKVAFAGAVPKSVQVRGPEGQLSPAQITDGKVLFVAKVPSVGYAVYDVVPSTTAMKSTLKVSPTSLENDRYKVAINADGDVASIWDKGLNKELLAAPIRMAFSKDTPKQYPAWNMDYEQEQAAPRNYVAGKPTISREGKRAGACVRGSDACSGGIEVCADDQPLGW